MKKIFVLTVLIGTLFVSCSKDDDNILPNKTTCNLVAEILTEDNFDGINTSSYTVTNVQLNGDCLEVTISSSGCDPEPWEMNLYSKNASNNISPTERHVKVELINNQLCAAVFQKTVSFDLTPFQLNEQNELPLNIEGWDEQVVYGY